MGGAALAICVASGLFLYIATLTQFSGKGWFCVGPRPVSIVFDSREADSEGSRRGGYTRAAIASEDWH